MKRIFILFVLFVLLLPLILLPISAEESGKTEVVLFENGKYNVDLELVLNKDIRKKIENTFTTHTGISYEKKNINNKTKLALITTENSNKTALNKITYNVTSNSLILNYDTEQNLDILLTELAKKLQALPQDKIVLDQSFLSIEKTSTAREDKEESFWDQAVAFFEDAGKLIKGFFNFFNIFRSSGDTETTLQSGGFNFIGENSNVNLLIESIYKALFPIGFIIMLICWGFGITKSSISSSLDIKDKNSIIHSILSLIIGLAAMSLAPQILTALTGISQWLCSIIDATTYSIPEAFNPIIKDISILEVLVGGIDNLTAVILVAIILEYVFMLNILWIALLQCLSPIFIGLMANRGTRKITFNFIREYIKALMIPVLTLTYYKLVSALLWDLGNANAQSHAGGFVVGILGSIVLAIATVSIAGKKLDKLIN